MRIGERTKSTLDIMAAITGQAPRDIVERALTREFSQMQSDGGADLMKAFEAVEQYRGGLE